MKITSNSAILIIFINLSLMLLWYGIVTILSKTLSVSLFNPEKKLYKERSWEKGGKLYFSFGVKKWKDKLPAHVGKNGFSKTKLTNMKNISKEYIDAFLLETCRGEWHHLICCMYIFIAILINPPIYAFVFCLLTILTNLPFMIIQRYNRIRLHKLKKMRNYDS